MEEIYIEMSEENKKRQKEYQKMIIKQKINIKITFFSLHDIKMEQKALIFDRQCINKNAFQKHKRPISIDKVEIRKIVLSKKDSYGKKGSLKYFIGHTNENDAFPVPLCIKLPQMNGYVKYFNDNKCMNLLVHDKKLSKNTMKYRIRLAMY